MFVFVKTERGSWRNDEPKGVVRPRTSSATPSVSATEAAALKPSTRSTVLLKLKAGCAI